MNTPVPHAPSRHAGLCVDSDVDVLAAQGLVRTFALGAGVSMARAEALVTAASEIARNALLHAGGGLLRLELVEQDDGRAVQIEVSDTGPGIADLELALSDGYTTGLGLGLGLPSARRLTDAMRVQTARKVGTIVTLRMRCDA